VWSSTGLVVGIWTWVAAHSPPIAVAHTSTPAKKKNRRNRQTRDRRCSPATGAPEPGAAPLAPRPFAFALVLALGFGFGFGFAGGLAEVRAVVARPRGLIVAGSRRDPGGTSASGGSTSTRCRPRRRSRQRI